MCCKSTRSVATLAATYCKMMPQSLEPTEFVQLIVTKSHARGIVVKPPGAPHLSTKAKFDRNV